MTNVVILKDMGKIDRRNKTIKTKSHENVIGIYKLCPAT